MVFFSACPMKCITQWIIYEQGVTVQDIMHHNGHILRGGNKTDSKYEFKAPLYEYW